MAGISHILEDSQPHDGARRYCIVLHSMPPTSDVELLN